MNSRANSERQDIAQELRAISQELESIAYEVRMIKGIGAEHCTSKLMEVAEEYQRIRYRLLQL